MLGDDYINLKEFSDKVNKTGLKNDLPRLMNWMIENKNLVFSSHLFKFRENNQLGEYLTVENKFESNKLVITFYVRRDKQFELYDLLLTDYMNGIYQVDELYQSTVDFIKAEKSSGDVFSAKEIQAKYKISTFRLIDIWKQLIVTKVVTVDKPNEVHPMLKVL